MCMCVVHGRLHERASYECVNVSMSVCLLSICESIHDSHTISILHILSISDKPHSQASLTSATHQRRRWHRASGQTRPAATRGSCGPSCPPGDPVPSGRMRGEGVGVHGEGAEGCGRRHTGYSGGVCVCLCVGVLVCVCESVRLCVGVRV